MTQNRTRRTWKKYDKRNSHKSNELNLIYVSSNNDRHPVTQTVTPLHYTCRPITSSYLKLHRTTLHCTCPPFTSYLKFHPNALHSTSQHLSTLHFFPFKPHPTTLHSTSQHLSTLHFFPFKPHPTTLHSTSQHLSTLHFFPFKLHPTTLHSTTLVDTSLFPI